MGFTSRKAKTLTTILLLLGLSSCSNDSGLSMSAYYQTVDSSGKTFHVGVGDLPSKLVERNPYLAEYGLRDDQLLRLSLGYRPTHVIYDDGDLRLEYCADRVNADGGIVDNIVKSSGAKACGDFINDYKSAIRLAQSIIKQFEMANPKAKRLNDWYRTTSDAEFERFVGGDANRSWSLFQPVSGEEAEAKFVSLIKRLEKSNQYDDRSVNEHALLGVYEGRYAIFRIGVDAAKGMGGVHLTEAQEKSIRYPVSLGFTKKRYSGSVLAPPVEWDMHAE